MAQTSFTFDKKLNDEPMKTSNQPLKVKVKELAIFDERHYYVNCSRIYFSYFEAIPSTKVIGGINYKTAIKWIENNLSDQILKKHSRQICIKDSRKQEFTTINYVLKDAILIKVGMYEDLVILFTDESAQKAEKLFHELKKFRQAHAYCLSMLIQDGNGLKLIDIKNKKPQMSIFANYNDDLNNLHKNIIRDLKKKNNSGLFLFHGTPGTGKSTYLRYLMHYTNKRVIFLPPKIAGNLDSPNLVKILVEEPNSILVIEDAENLLISREKGNESSISMLLNLTDGLLGESLGIQVICSIVTKG